MAKSKQAVSEVQLKARRTSLEKKSKDDLISIILRKDKSERSLNCKIQQLTTLVNEADTTINSQNDAIEKLRVTANDNYDHLQQSFTDNAILRKKIEDFDEKTANDAKRIVELKNTNKVLRKTCWTCFAIIAILIILLFIF